MGTGNDSILDAFLYETNTLLEQLDSIVLADEKENDFSEEDVNTIFRIMHTIKGSSAMMEYNSLMTVAHRVEDMFSIIRDNSMTVVPDALRPALFDLLFQVIDFFRSEIERIENGQPLSTNIDTLVGKINSFISQIKNGGEPDTSSAQGESGSSGALEPNAEFPYLLQVFFDEGCGMENLRAYMLVTSIRDLCGEEDFIYEPEDAQTNSASAAQIAESGFLLRFRRAEDRDNAIHTVTNAGSVRTYQLSDCTPAPAPQPVSQAAPASPSQPSAADTLPVADTPPVQSAAAPVAKADKALPPTASHHRESLISVNLSKLDELSAVVGEIVITESMVTASPDLKDLKLDTFTKSARQLRKLTDQLQDVTMSLRMVPLSGTFQKMNRIVRDMCKKLGKQCTLTLVGEDTEVDKTIVDSISDPIMHIVRNSMDHGIEETPEARIAAGKDPTGEITLSACHAGSEVVIEIRDDGQGVNCDAVLKKAIRNGLAFPDTDYSKQDILNFLMTPGFSTNTEVTEFSGRGVGMDVVKQNVESVGGTVVISSEEGKGMTTTLKIPLTTAILDGMEVSVGDSIFTIPIHNIRQSFKIRSSDIIHDAAGGELFKCMDRFYPVVRMRDLYQLEGGCTAIEDGILIWLDTGGENSSYCLFVDELLGEQQAVFKPLPNYVNSFNIKSSGISGCTILGDGSISFILDVNNLYCPVQ